MEVPSATPEILVSAFSQGLVEGKKFRSLVKMPVKDFGHLLGRETKYINVEETQFIQKKEVVATTPATAPERRVPLKDLEQVLCCIIRSWGQAPSSTLRLLGLHFSSPTDGSSHYVPTTGWELITLKSDIGIIRGCVDQCNWALDNDHPCQTEGIISCWMYPPPKVEPKECWSESARTPTTRKLSLDSHACRATTPANSRGGEPQQCFSWSRRYDI